LHVKKTKEKQDEYDLYVFKSHLYTLLYRFYHVDRQAVTIGRLKNTKLDGVTTKLETEIEQLLTANKNFIDEFKNIRNKISGHHDKKYFTRNPDGISIDDIKIADIEKLLDDTRTILESNFTDPLRVVGTSSKITLKDFFEL